MRTRSAGRQGRKGHCANKDVVFAHTTIAGPPTATRLRPAARGCPEARGATPGIHARQDAPTLKGLRPWGGPAPSPRHRVPRRDTTPLGLGGIRLRCPRVAAGTPQPGAPGWNPVGVRKASRDPPPPVLATQTQRRSQARPSQPFLCLLPAYGMPVGKKSPSIVPDSHLHRPIWLNLFRICVGRSAPCRPLPSVPGPSPRPASRAAGAGPRRA